MWLKKKKKIPGNQESRGDFRLSYDLTNYVTLGESSSRSQFLFQLSHGSKRETKYPDGVTSASKGIGIDGCVYKKSNNLINIQVQAQYNIYILYNNYYISYILIYDILINIYQ